MTIRYTNHRVGLARNLTLSKCIHIAIHSSAYLFATTPLPFKTEFVEALVDNTTGKEIYQVSAIRRPHTKKPALSPCLYGAYSPMQIRLLQPSGPPLQRMSQTTTSINACLHSKSMCSSFH